MQCPVQMKFNSAFKFNNFHPTAAPNMYKRENKLNEIIQITIILIRSYFKCRNIRIEKHCPTIDCIMMCSHSFQVQWTWNRLFYCWWCASVYLIRLERRIQTWAQYKLFFFVVVFFLYCLAHDRIILCISLFFSCLCVCVCVSLLTIFLCECVCLLICLFLLLIRLHRHCI